MTVRPPHYLTENAIGDDHPSAGSAMDAQLDQTTITASAASFEAILRWLDAEPTEAEAAGMDRLRRGTLWS